MSSLTVTVKVAGVNGTGLAVAIYPQSDFRSMPQRTHAAPNAAATATGTTNGSGQVTLSGLSAVEYELMVTDARGVNNWFHVAAGYVGGSFTASIPWTTPATATKSVSTGGDTPGGPVTNAPWAQREHFHEIDDSETLAFSQSVGSGSSGSDIALTTSWVSMGSTPVIPGANSPGGVPVYNLVSAVLFFANLSATVTTIIGMGISATATGHPSSPTVFRKMPPGDQIALALTWPLTSATRSGTWFAVAEITTSGGLDNVHCSLQDIIVYGNEPS